MKRARKLQWILPGALAGGLLAGLGGCKAAAPAAPRTDGQVARDIQSKIGGEQALSGQSIAVTVQDGRATLSGVTTDDASRALAANEAGSIDGVKTVINNLAVLPVQRATVPPASDQTASPPIQSSSQRRESRDREKKERDRERKQRAQEYRPPANQQAAVNTPTPAPAAAPAPAPETIRTVAPPPAPPKPVAKLVTVPAGTTLPVRMTDALDSATTQTGATFRASLANDLVVNGMIAAPRGATVIGRVVDARDASHFKGSSLLSIELTTLDAHGQHIGLTTDAFSKEGSGRGKNTATKAGVGAGVGAIIGALAGGGRGAAIGAAAGGGVGAGSNGVTRGQQVQIPTETVVNFTLRSDISVTTSQQLGGPRNFDSNQGPDLQKRE